MLSKRKLLVLTNNPHRASFRQRIGIYLDILKASGIDCQVAQLPAGLSARQKLFKRATDFDGVFLQKKKLNLLDGHWLRRYSKKIIYDFDDAVMYDPEAADRKSSSHFRPFRRTAKLADLVIAGNSYLAEHARRFNRRVEVVPTGLDTRAYRVQAKSDDDGKIRLVWIGSHSTLRYLAEIKPALEDVGRQFDHVILRIICDEFFDLQDMPVEKRQWSEATQALDLAACDIGLSPLSDNRFSRGKCGFKILQYAAAGLPVIASPVGVNADYVRDGVTGFLATGLSDWTDRIAALLRDPTAGEKMGAEGRKSVRNFDMTIVGEQLCILLKALLQQNDSYNG